MLDDRGFDLWADGYDRQVGISDAENSYPFAGYREILGRIYRMVMAHLCWISGSAPARLP